VWEEFSPLTCTSHMVDDFSAECFVFLGGVGFVHDTVLSFLLETRTEKTIFDTLITVETIP